MPVSKKIELTSYHCKAHRPGLLQAALSLRSSHLPASQNLQQFITKKIKNGRQTNVKTKPFRIPIAYATRPNLKAKAKKNKEIIINFIIVYLHYNLS